MSLFPSTPANYPQERVGVAAVHFFAAASGQIWRETPTGDVGIDGQLEHVDSKGAVTGRTVAVQIKCGPSYFANPTAHGWKFYPDPKHRLYWERYPLPVLLMLHDPTGQQSYWVDVRKILRTPGTENSAYLVVPKENVLQLSTPDQLFMHAGAQPDEFIETLDAVIDALVQHSHEGSMPVSYFDLFTQGLTNICRSLYFSMDLVLKAAESNLEAADSEFGVGVGGPEHDFVFDYIRFLVAQNLADIDFTDCLIDWQDRQLTPKFIAPLTVRGRALVKAIHSREKAFVDKGELPSGAGLSVAQEGFVEMVEMSYFRRRPRIRQFQQVLRSKLEPVL